MDLKNKIKKKLSYLLKPFNRVINIALYTNKVIAKPSTNLILLKRLK